MKRVFIEKLDPAQSDGRRGAGKLLLVGQIEKVSAKFFFSFFEISSSKIRFLVSPRASSVVERTSRRIDIHA